MALPAHPLASNASANGATMEVGLRQKLVDLFSLMVGVGKFK
jgi:hypothetical protein